MGSEKEKNISGDSINFVALLILLETRALESKYKKEYPKCETDRDSREH